MDQLEISNAAVFNALVDHSEIERQALVSSFEEMEHIAYSQSHNNISCTWLPNGSRAYVRSGSRVFRSAPKNMAPLLQKDVTAFLAEKQREMEQLEKDRLEQARHEGSSRHELRSVLKERETISAKANRVRSKVSKLKAEVDRLGIHVDSMAGEFDSSEWDQLIAVAETEVSLTREELNCRRANVVLLTEEILELEEKGRSHPEDVLGSADHHQGLIDEINNLWANVREQTARRNKFESKVKSLESRVRARKTALRVAEEELATQTSQAMSLCPQRIERDERTSIELSEQIEGIERRLKSERARNDGLSEEAIETELLRLRAKFKDAQQNLKKLHDYNHQIERGYSERLKSYHNSLREIKRAANTLFGQYLATRGHSGELIFTSDDHGRDQLEIHVRIGDHHVAVDVDDAAGTRRSGTVHHTTVDMRSLSGGERSFTTLCFMLALSEQMEIPFRVMDEFDVFMDEANRSSAIRTLVSVATDIPQRQFIFITPLDLPPLPQAGTPSLRLQRLEDPERR